MATAAGINELLRDPAKLEEANLKLALSLYRVDLMLIELLRQTLTPKLEDAAELAELEETLKGLELVKFKGDDGNTSFLPISPPVMLTRGERVYEVCVCLKMEEEGDRERWDEMGDDLKENGRCETMDQDPTGKIMLTRHNAHANVMRACGVLILTMRKCFGMWKFTGMLEQLMKIDPCIAELKFGVIADPVEGGSSKKAETLTEAEDLKRRKFREPASGPPGARKAKSRAKPKEPTRVSTTNGRVWFRDDCVLRCDIILE